MLFCFNGAAFPVDTHIAHLAAHRRQPAANLDKIMRIWEGAAAACDLYALHQLDLPRRPLSRADVVTCARCNRSAITANKPVRGLMAAGENVYLKKKGSEITTQQLLFFCHASVGRQAGQPFRLHLSSAAISPFAEHQHKPASA
jgi:hypothetical protein